MPTLRSLFPAHLDAGTWAVLALCAIVLVVLAVSVVVPWARHRKQRSRIARGDY